MKKRFVPRQGDVVWLGFGEGGGHEQRGRRPALVVSASAYNARVGLALVCPVTSRAKGYPFEVAIDGVIDVEGVVLADHVRSVDWRARRATFAGAASAQCMAEVAARIAAVLKVEGE